MNQADQQRRLFGLQDLRRTEANVRATSEIAIAGLYENFPRLIEALLHLGYARGDGPDPASPQGFFYWHACTHYFQAPYTLTAVYDLSNGGYYFESVVLLRAIVENLVQLRYFHQHPEQIEAHLLNTSRVHFVTMFDSLAPGYYKAQYGNFFSAFAHGKLGQLYFRYDHSDRANRRVRHGCEYSEEHASLIVNHLTVFAFGFLNNFCSFFPAHTLRDHPNVAEELDSSLEWLERAMTAHKAEFPASAIWYALIDGLIR